MGGQKVNWRDEAGFVGAVKAAAPEMLGALRNKTLGLGLILGGLWYEVRRSGRRGEAAEPRRAFLGIKQLGFRSGIRSASEGSRGNRQSNPTRL